MKEKICRYRTKKSGRRKFVIKRRQALLLAPDGVLH